MRPPTHVVVPETWAPDGTARTRLGDRDLLVFGGIPGERARVVVEGAGRYQVRARLLAVLGRPDPARRDPPCRRYVLCGGCPLMHLAEPAQREARLAVARAAFREHGVEDLAPRRVVGSPDGDWGYRHVVKLLVGTSEQGRLRLGAPARGTRRPVTIPECGVVTETLRGAMRVLARAIIEVGVPPWTPSTPGGVLRHAILRQSRATGEVIAVLVAGRRDRAVGEVARLLEAGCAAVAGVYAHLNDDPGNALLRPDRSGFDLLCGRPLVEERVLGVRLQVGPGDFFQANPGTAERIVEDVADFFDPLRDRPVLDLYAGVGAFALPLARRHGWALGVERGLGAVERARENVRLNRLSAEFVAGDVAELLPELARRLEGRAPVVVLDPPRRGLEPEVIDALDALAPSAVAYVSCNARTLARDLRRLRERGWRVGEVTAYDMFPQTAHVELLARLLPARAPEPRRRAPRRHVVR